MCPFCLATAAVIAGSAGTGGVTAFIAGTILKRNQPKLLPREEEVNHGSNRNTHSDTEDRLAP
jgi:hypothetical protein